MRAVLILLQAKVASASKCLCQSWGHPPAARPLLRGLICRVSLSDIIKAGGQRLPVVTRESPESESYTQNATSRGAVG
ncbi:hypothetical protein BDR03DRAFT_964842 [Suillus americanus]|nr:hypothetical protein BDR03DRAFT_964842 [Suillus americanus]